MSAPTYSAGDTITLEKDDDRLVRKVVNGDQILVLTHAPHSATTIGVLIAEGWSITSVTPKREPIPTEPGYYPYAASGLLWLSDGGAWFNAANNYQPVTTEYVAGVASDHALIRLIPESDLTAAVAEAKQEAYREVRQSVEHHLGIDFGWCNSSAMGDDAIKAGVNRAFEGLEPSA